MACRFEVTLSDEEASLVPAALEALGEAERVEATLTVFRPSSEVMRLNADAHAREVIASDDLFGLLERCRALHADTGGAFDPTTLPLSRAWGFLDRRPARPSDEALAAARRAVGMDRVALDPGCRGVRFLAPGMALNFGSIGKGYAVQRIADALAARGAADALVSAGGSSVAAVGPRRWPVDVVARAAGRTIARLLVRQAALGTSGAGEQFLDVDGVRRAHVIDPRSGWPAAGVLSASVVTDDAADADALATACFVGGVDVARLVAARPRTLVILAPDEAGAPSVVIGSHPSVIVEAS
jgi:thiamine biosynthesis lipoprotein